MSIVDSMRSLAFQLRGLPGRLGYREYSIQLTSNSWDGGEVGQGTESEVLTSVTEGDSQNPKVRFLTSEQRLVAGLQNDSIEVGPITPRFSAGGTTYSALDILVGSTDTVYQWIVTGPRYPAGARFRLVSAKSDRANQFTCVLERAAD